MPSIHYTTGTYLCRVTEQRISETQNTYPQLVMGFEVLAKRTSDNEDQPVEGPPRRWYRPLTDQTIKHVMDDMDALGWHGMNWEIWDQDDRRHMSLLGQEVLMRCNHKPHYKTGEPHEEWSVYRPYEVPKASKSAMSQLQALDAQLKARNRDKQEAAPQKPKSDKPVEQAADGMPFETYPPDDDIPF